MRANMMQVPSENREVLTPPRKKVKGEADELMKGIRKVPPAKFPSMMGDTGSWYQSRCSQEKQPRPVKHVPAEWESPPGAEVDRPSPPKRTSTIRLRLLSVAPAKGGGVVVVWSSRVEPATLRVRRVRLNHSAVVRTERSNVAQCRISDRRVVSR